MTKYLFSVIHDGETAKMMVCADGKRPEWIEMSNGELLKLLSEIVEAIKINNRIDIARKN